jgi:hypothetical protein
VERRKRGVDMKTAGRKTGNEQGAQEGCISCFRINSTLSQARHDSNPYFY